MASSEERIIALIDMDCFFCQVESREQPELIGKPMVVSQFNMVLAVNYEARELGVGRLGRGDEAKEKCPELIIVNAPERRGKGDISKYRSAGQEVINVLNEHCSIVERASIDEAFLDLTKLVEEKMTLKSMSSNDIEKCLANTYVIGYCDETNDEEKRDAGTKNWVKESFDDMGDEWNRKLAIAGLIVEELRAEIFEKCKFRCSAGISHNKILAKLACGLHKPNKQTILPISAVPELYSTLPVNKVRNLGGKIGKMIVENLECKVMADLLRFSLKDLQKHFDEKTGIWLYNIARGMDYETVTSRLLCKSIGASKNFWGDETINKLEKLREWVDVLAVDVSERLEQDLQENQRRATTLTVSYQYCRDKKNISQSRAAPLTSYKAEKIASHAYEVVAKSMQTPIVYLSIAATKFVEGQKNFVNYFKVQHETLDKKTEIDDKNGGKTNNGIEKISNISLHESEGSLVKLEDIFPDLDNIDDSVVKLLPIELQQEARTYLQSTTKVDSNSDIKSDIKNSSKSKQLKKKLNTGKNSNKSVEFIQNFFANKVTSCDESSMIKCDKCNKMIEGEKYLEHCDFHVAQNLQKDINQSSSNRAVENQKRNRHSPSDDSSKSRKKPRSIESYFCRS